MTDQNKSAPAPSSLAGGEEAEFATALARVLDRHGLRDAGWADADIDEALSVVREPSAVSRATVDAILPMISERLAALSPEAPAREGVDLRAIAKDAAERVHKNGGCVPQMAYAPILFALQDALIPRHEAPAPTCQKCGGEAQGWTCQVCGASFRENDDGSLVFACHEAPAEGAGEVLSQIIAAYRNLDDDADKDAVIAHLCDLLEHPYLRARSSAPEAREVEPAAWERAWSRHGEVKTKEHTPKGWNLFPVTQARLLPTDEPLYRHPAAPSADKLREAALFLSERLTDFEQDVNERDYHGHVAPAAARLLAALKAEGA
jgi:hypothetical protein